MENIEMYIVIGVPIIIFSAYIFVSNYIDKKKKKK